MLEGAAILFIRGAEYKLIENYHGGEHGGRAHFPISSYDRRALYPDSEQAPRRTSSSSSRCSRSSSRSSG